MTLLRCPFTSLHVRCLNTACNLDGDPKLGEQQPLEYGLLQNVYTIMNYVSQPLQNGLRQIYIAINYFRDHYSFI